MYMARPPHNWFSLLPEGATRTMVTRCWVSRPRGPHGSHVAGEVVAEFFPYWYLFVNLGGTVSTWLIWLLLTLQLTFTFEAMMRGFSWRFSANILEAAFAKSRRVMFKKTKSIMLKGFRIIRRAYLSPIRCVLRFCSFPRPNGRVDIPITQCPAPPSEHPESPDELYTTFYAEFCRS